MRRSNAVVSWSIATAIISLLTVVSLRAGQGPADPPLVSEQYFKNIQLLKGMTVDVKGDDGQVVSWLVELQAPNTIYPAGYRINTFKPGDPVTVAVHAVTNGRPYARVVSVMLADGRTLGDGVRADTPAP